MSIHTTAGIRPLSEETRGSILSTAGEVFAEYGFHATTVREICRRAGVNVAAINYHFGSKEELYLHVLESAHVEAARKYPYVTSKSDPPEKRLEGFIYSFIQGFLDEGRSSWHGKLMAREMVEPTAALKRMVERTIRPRNVELTGIVRELMGASFSDEEVARAVFSVIGQCYFYYHARAVIARLRPEIDCGQEGAKQAAAHVTKFSLGALKQMSLGRKGGR